MSSFSVVKPSYLENTNNIIINGNLTVNGTVTKYLDLSFSSFASNISFLVDSSSYNDSTQGKFGSGVLAPNGNIYCVHYSSNYILVINPLTNSTIRIPISMTIGAKYIGAVCKPNGKIYCIPFNSDTIMIIDSNTNTVSTLYTINTSNYPTIGSNNEKWCSGVLYNDFIYCAPYSAQAVLIINTVNDTIDVTSISGINLTNYASVLNTRNTEKFFSIVLGLNGLIYCLPSSADTVMIINPNINIIDMSTLSFTRFGLPVGSSNRFRFFGACLGPDGNIYASPWNYDRMIKIDTRTSSLSSVTIPSLVSGTNAFYGTICGSDGKIYGVPFSSSYVLIYDVTNGNVDTTSISGITGSTKYTGAVLSRNDNIYFIPRHASQIMYIKIGLPNQTSWVYSCIFNKL